MLCYVGLCKIFPIRQLTQEECDIITLGPYANTFPPTAHPDTLYKEDYSSYGKESSEEKSDKTSQGEGKVELVV